MAFQLCALIISVLIISLLILKGLHPILSVIIGCSLMIWTNGLPYAATFTSGLESWGAAMMPTIFVTLLGAAFGVLYTKCGAIDSLARFLMKPSGLMKSANGKIVMCILGLVAFRVVLGIAGFANEAIIVTMLAVSGVIFRTADVDRRHLPALTAFAAPGDGVLLHSPTYIGFTRSIENNGYRIVHSPLTLDERGVWRMDYEDMDRKLKEHHIHVAVFCSPHNPCGRVWERWEIEKAMEVYKANDCVVISDEIWSDLTLGNHQHIPTQSVSEDARNRTVAFYAPSKTFNLAGLVGSYHIIYNPTLRDRIVAKSSKCHYNDMNVLSMHALIGAYRPEGHEWLDELKAVLTGNVDYAYDYITKHFQGVSLAKPEGTYMLLLDCEQWCERHGLSLPELEKRGWDVGVAWQDGSMFQAPYSIRVNLALPLSRVKEAMRRLDQYVFNA